MTSPRVALATAAEFPNLDEDGPALLAALSRRGVEATPEVWTDPAVDWSSYDAVVIRSTWDYAPRRDDYLSWAARVASVSRLANPLDVLRWNTHKRYLQGVEAAGLPVVHTDWLEPGATWRPPERGEYVVKPAVSAGSRDTNRYLAGVDDEAACAHVAELHAAGRTVMVQPYLADIDTYGETALLFFAGEYSHAIRKGPMLERLGAPVEGAYKEERISRRDPSDAERDVAERVLGALPWSRHDLTYARVDLVPSEHGPTVIEIELTEPSMFLGHDPQAADRFAAAIAALAGSR